MLFNSLSFLIFLPIVFALYWFLQKKKLIYQNLLILIASYFFYASWDWRFLFLLMFSTILDYYTGLKIHHSTTINWRKIWLWISIGINLGFLFLFKYYNFFAVSFHQFLEGFGFKVNVTLLNIVLPVGISFYTFHGLSYVIDIYHRRIKPENNFIVYADFVSFFPLLVAGPIERATHLLPQLKKKRVFNYSQAVDGLRQILWGFFKKVVIADQCAVYVNEFFADYNSFSGFTLMIGAILFAFQIYGDFSGYSDIALGTARLFGIELLTNFRYPYFSRDIAEFWRRWHISLSSWFRDYVFIPLGGSRGTFMLKIRNIFIIFLLSGFWHGANWTFIIWGGLNALYYIPVFLLGNNKKNIDTVGENGKISYKDIYSIIITFSLTTIAWIFFRSNTVNDAFSYLNIIFSKSFFQFINVSKYYLIGFLFLYITILLFIEWKGRFYNHPLKVVELISSRYLRYFFYYFILILVILMWGRGEDFIYFQF